LFIENKNNLVGSNIVIDGGQILWKKKLF
jgi:hypothetical protein